jgi:hypothetical protein
MQALAITVLMMVTAMQRPDAQLTAAGFLKPQSRK